MFKKKESREERSPVRRFSDQVGEMDTILGAGVHIQGELKGKANVEVRGSFDGIAEFGGLLYIHEGGKFKGQASATNVIVEGQLEGNVSASEKVELRASGRINGDIQAASVAIAEGCFYEGRIEMRGDRVTRDRVSFREKRTSGETSDTSSMQRDGLPGTQPVPKPAETEATD